jgi:acetylornithine/N-succinyldiaminopimelate aminotransferase
MPNYGRSDLAFEKGEGSYLFEVDGRRYLDFATGIAVNALGHAHPKMVAALKAQGEKLWHTSNLYQVPEQTALAQTLVDNSFADTVFFCNSGAEAVEAGLKVIRRYWYNKGETKKRRVITAGGAFHGRSLATIVAGGAEKYTEGFDPLIDGFDQVPFGNLNVLRDAISEETAAILVEPVQGESGIKPAAMEYLQGLRQTADEFGLLLMFDEVQTGIGRTGKLFAHEHAGVTPDVLASAKGLGGGFPIGACLATEAAGSALTPGTHGSTFGGNPLACAVAKAVVDEVLADGFLDHVTDMGTKLRGMLERFGAAHPKMVEEVRGAGLMLGMKLTENVVNADVLKLLRTKGLLTAPAGDNVLRFLPPLNIDETHIAEAIAALEAVASELEL